MRSKFLILSCLLILMPATSQAGPRRPPAPPYDLIRQGGSATCWILASMEALQYSGVDLSQQVQRVGPNRYRIHLFNYKDPKNRQGGGTHPEIIPVLFNGKTTDQDAKINPGEQRAYWVVALHRGVIQAVHEWDPSQTVEKTHGGGANDAFGILTGRRGWICPPRMPTSAKRSKRVFKGAQQSFTGRKVTFMQS